MAVALSSEFSRRRGPSASVPGFHKQKYPVFPASLRAWKMFLPGNARAAIARILATQVKT